MEELVTLKEAKRSQNLPLDVSVGDKEYQDILDAAHAVVEARVKNRVSGATEWAAVVDAWDSDTAPRDVIRGIKFMFGYLKRRTGDDTEQDVPLGPTGLPLVLEILLGNYSDRSLA